MVGGQEDDWTINENGSVGLISCPDGWLVCQWGQGESVGRLSLSCFTLLADAHSKPDAYYLIDSERLQGS